MVAKTVLVVENDPCIRIVAEEMFAAAGIEVESVLQIQTAVKSNKGNSHDHDRSDGR